MKQIERIRHMEQLLNRVSAAVTELSDTPGPTDEIQEAADELKEYYGSDEWKQDFADDEAGLLPHDLKRGVLSEDGIWNALDEWDELKDRLQK